MRICLLFLSIIHSQPILVDLVSTVSTERTFSAMKIVKTRLRKKIEDNLLRNLLVIYIEREIAEKITVDTTIDKFSCMKERRVVFK